MSDRLDGDALVENRVAEARAAHARGWSLTPQRGKRCYRVGWQSEPPADLDTVEAWARLGNLAVRTGSISGVLVLDDDTASQNAAVFLGLPPTPTVLTGSGRRHHYFCRPAFTVRNSTGLLLPHLDVKGERGATTFVGSVHPATGAVYRWLPGYSPDDLPLAPLPANVLDRLRPPPVSATTYRPPTLPPDTEGRSARYAAGALRGAALRVFDAREGTRNATLNRETFGLARYIAAGLLSRARVEDVMAEAAHATGLSDFEIAATLRSALDGGLREPRHFRLPEARS